MKTQNEDRVLFLFRQPRSLRFLFLDFLWKNEKKRPILVSFFTSELDKVFTRESQIEEDKSEVVIQLN